MIKINEKLLLAFTSKKYFSEGKQMHTLKYLSDSYSCALNLPLNVKNRAVMSVKRINNTLANISDFRSVFAWGGGRTVGPQFSKIALLLFLTIASYACKDEVWEDHFDNKTLVRSNLNVYEYLNSRPDLSTFSKMVKSIGYDTVLTQNLTYTVWAPVNSVLDKIDLKDSILVRRIVLNHISQFSYSTSAASRLKQPVLVLNNKLQHFVSTNGSSLFDGNQLSESDHAMKNGIVHILDNYSDYKKNFWEYIKETPGLDSLYQYINSLSIKELDYDKSYEQTVFKDSIFKYTNYVFDNLAVLNSEDSVYTAILPDNDAWTKAYKTIFPYLKTKEKDGGVARQVEDTKKVLVNNLFFKGNLTMPLSPDSIVATSGNYLLHADRLFNASPVVLSNGTAYKTTELKEQPTDVWLKPVKIEAENFARFGGVTSNYNTNTISSLGTGFTTSGDRYLSLIDAATSSLSQTSIRFPVYNYLSTKYNVYCVFVPAKAVDNTDLRPYKVCFAYSTKGTSSDNDLMIDTNRVVTKVVYNPNTSASIVGKALYTIRTNPEKVDKVLVLKNFEIPERYMYTAKTITTTDLINSIGFSIKVINATGKTASELAKFNRNLKIDCLILEPVQ